MLALLRVTRVAAGHRGWALRAAAVLGVLWVILRVAGAPVASSSAAALAVDKVQSVQADLHDRSVLARQLANDPFRDTPGNQLLTGLRGKDVLLVFVESYGRSAVQGSSFSPRIDRVLDQGRQQLHAAGFDARSGFLTSPTFGGLSWLAHSTMQSGIKVTGQRRYDQLVETAASRSRARSSAPAGGRSARCRPTTGRGRRARASTATTRSTTAATSATAAPTSACRRCPTSTRWRPSSAASSPRPAGRRCSPRST